MKMILIKAHFVAFLQIYDKLSSFSKFKISNFKNIRHCFSGLGDKVKLSLKSDIRHAVAFLQNCCRIFSCYTFISKGVRND